jgi:hypothetical protein
MSPYFDFLMSFDSYRDLQSDTMLKILDTLIEMAMTTYIQYI